MSINGGQMSTNSICMNTAKSLKSCNGCRDNLDSSTSILDSSHLKTSTPLKNTNCTKNNESVKTCDECFVSHATSEKKQPEVILDLLKKNDLDNNILKSQDEKLILEVANKNKNFILPLDISQINTQEFIKLNLDMVTRNLEASHSHFDTSKKDIDESIDSDDIIAIYSQTNSKSIENGIIFDKTKNPKCTTDLNQDSETLSETEFHNLKPPHTQYNTHEKNMDSNGILVVSSPQSSCVKYGIIDLDQDSEILDGTQDIETSKQQNSEFSKQDQNNETQFQNLNPSHRQSVKEIVEVLSSDDMYSPEFIKLKDFMESDTNRETVSKCKNFTLNPKFSTIDLNQDNETLHETQGPKTSNHGTTLSKDQNSEINFFRSMCEELMFKIKPLVDIDCGARNDKVIHFTKSNPDVLKCVSYENCPSTTSTTKSSCYTTHCENSNNIPEQLAANNLNMSFKRKISSEMQNGTMQIHYERLNKKLKLTSSRNTLKRKSRSTLINISNKPKVTNSVNSVVVTSSEDEDDCVLIKNKLPKVQNTLPIFTQTRFIDLTETNKHCAEVKPIFTCSPNGQIHKDMLNYIEKKRLLNK